MSAIQYIDILKRDNANLLVKRARQGKMIVGMTSKGDPIEMMGKIRIAGHEYKIDDRNAAAIKDTVVAHVTTSKVKKIEIFTEKGWMVVTKFFKDHEFSGLKPRASAAGKSHAERQERGLVELIQQATMSGPFKIPPFQHPIVAADKVEGLSALGQEPYTDIVLIDSKNDKWNISCKGETAASLGGGGLKGIANIVPGVVRSLFEAIQRDMQADGFVNGEEYDAKKVPDYFYNIPQNGLRRIFTGDARMGGPVDYMYIGPMDVKLTNNTFNGQFIPIDKYITKYPFFFRLRKRDILGGRVKIDFDTKDRSGFPVIFKSGGRQASRIVIDKMLPSQQKPRDL